MIIIEGYEEIKIIENKELKERFIDERTGNIGKYGRLKLNYMQMQKCLYKLYHLHIRNQLQSRETTLVADFLVKVANSNFN